MTERKIKVLHKVDEYEGIAASNALGMAFFETSGLRRLIDKRCKYDPEKRILPPGMVMKSMLGPMFNITKKYPLYMVETAYSTAPTDLLFGEGVTCDNLYDTALGRGLDTLFDADLTSLFVDCANLICEKYGFSSDIYHMDATDISFTGIEHLPDKEGAAAPKRNGHPKDHRFELLQYELQIVSDSNRIIRYIKPYSGNVADCHMDSDTLHAFMDMHPPEELKKMTFVGDCKMATSANILDIIDAGASFVSRCDENFVGRSKRGSILASRVSENSRSRNGRWTSDVDLDVPMSKNRKERLRFVMRRSESDFEEALSEIRADAVRKAEETIAKIRGTRFKSEKEAMAAFRKIEPKKGSTFTLDAEVVAYKGLRPEDDDWVELSVTSGIDGDAVTLAAEMRTTFVVVTNLPRPSEDGGPSPDGRPARTAREVMEIYNQEYKVEHSFRLMKSGMGMNSIFLQTPSRENAMMFVISIAVLITNAIDAILKRADARLDGKTATMYRLAYKLQSTNVEYSRSENSLWLHGPAGISKIYFDITDKLGINPQYLLGYLSD